MRGEVGSGGAGAVTDGRDGGARVAGGSSPRGVSIGSLVPDNSSSELEPSLAGALAIGAAGGGRAVSC